MLPFRLPGWRLATALSATVVALFTASPAARAQGSVTILHSFATPEGTFPRGVLVQGTDGFLYGAGGQGGASNLGAIFKIKPDGTGYQTLHSLVSTEGTNIYGSGVALGSDGYVYGSAYTGGVAGYGSVFRVKTDGTGFQILHSFNYTVDGAYVWSAPILASDGRLYGTTLNGTSTGYGSVYRLNTDGTGFQTIHSFSTTGTEGSNPYGRLLQASDGKLYGTTNGSGTGSGGTIFRLNLDGTQFTVIHAFSTTVALGANPLSGVMQASDGVLYGGTQGGGTNGYSVLYAINLDGTGYRVLHNFTSAEGTNCYNAVPLEASDGALYSSVYGGSSINGCVYKINRDGSGFSVIQAFTGTNNLGYPLGSVMQCADGSIVGLSYHLGTGNGGSMWRIGPAITSPLTATATWNSPFAYTITASGSPTSFNATNLPAGLTVDTTTGIISGTPTVVGTFSVSISASGTLGAGSATLTLTVNKAAGTVTLGNLSQTYDGTAKSATATTTPGNLTVNFSYSGPSLPPVNAGNYGVIATISDAYYTGSKSGTLTIAKAPVTITLGNLTQTYTGQARPATYTTAPSGISATLTYNGSSSAPLNVGNYTVVATANSTNYAGNVTGTLSILPAAASISFGNEDQVYNGAPHAITLGTTPSGLTTTTTYNGSTALPVNAGSYAVVSTVVSANYAGNATTTLVVEPASVALTLGNLVQPYDGTPKTVSVTSSVTGVPISITYNNSSSAPTAVGNYTVVANTADDNYAGVATGTLQITDTIPPVLTVPANLLIEATSAAGATATFTASATDNVTASPAIAYSIASGSTFPIGTTTVNVTATDDVGNVANGSFTVTVQDTTAPTIAAPANIVIEATSAAGAVATFDASATDLVDGTVNVSSDHASGETFPIGTTAVTLTATDAAGNVAHAVFSVTVSDTTAPVIAAQDNLIVEATSANGAAVSFTPSASDIVSGAVAVTASPASGSTFALGDTTVTLTAVDAAGNQATSTFTVTVRDTTAPAIAAPANAVIEATSAAGASLSFAPTATDLVDGDVAVTSDHASGETFPIGTTVVTLTATDKAGNTARAAFSVTVRDTTAPVLHVPANLTVEATSAAGASATFTASAIDAVTASPVIGYSIAPGSVFALGTTTVAVTATDAAGNVSKGAFTVTVVDKVAPTLTVPANQVIEATSAAGAMATFTASATDAVTATPTISYSLAPGSTFGLGTTTVQVTARDGAGNASTGSFTVTVRDTTAPVLTVPANQTLDAKTAAGAVATFAASATDAVTIAPTIAYSSASGSTFPIGTTTVTVTATDAAGNKTSGSFTITVRDTIAPTISSLTASPNSIWPPNKKMVPVTITATTADNIGVASTKIVSVTTNEPDGNTQWQITGDLTLTVLADRLGNGNGRTYTITVEARDAAGNATRKTVTVSVPHDQGK